MTGTWKGYYQYNNKRAQKSIGFDKTNFIVTITSFDGRQFEGIVVDDGQSGGMEGEGQIFGKIENNSVSFEKLMPHTTYVFRDGKRKVLDKKHPTLHYSGTISENKMHMEGLWKFNWHTVMLFGIIPFPFKGSSGTWSMTLQ